MENRRKIWRKFVECSSFWCSYPFGLRALILNWSNSRKYVLGEAWLCSSKKKWLQFWALKRFRFWENLPRIFGKSATDFEEIRRRFWENPSPILGKSVTDFGEMSHRFWENEPPTLGKWTTDYGKMSHRLWENEPPTTGKWATDFGKMNHRLQENEPPTLGKWATDFGEKWATDFGEMSSGDAWKFETDYFKKYLYKKQLKSKFIYNIKIIIYAILQQTF